MAGVARRFVQVDYPSSSSSSYIYITMQANIYKQHLSSCLLNFSEAVLAWQSQQAAPKSGGGEGGGGQSGMEGGTQTLSRLEKLQTITRFVYI